MKEKIKQAVQNPLISGSAIIFFGTLFANALNFLFNFFMSRNLSVSDYGVLSSLVSIVTLFALAADSFIPTIVHFSGTFFAKKEIGKVIGIFHELNRYFFIQGAIILILFTVFSRNIGIFFNINNQELIMLIGVSLLVTFIGTVNRGILQAKLAFGYISFVNIASSIVKLGVGIWLIILGFKVQGALWGYVISSFVAYFITFFPLKFLLSKRNNSSGTKIKEMFAYGGPSALSLIGLTLFITLDVILVKHFFPSKEAGIYAGLSLLGKIIYFLTAPVTSVLFPLVVRRHAKRERYIHFLGLGMILVFIASVPIIAGYYLLPDFFIKLLLKKEEYLAIRSVLGIFAVFMTIYSLLALTTNFYLSIKKTIVVIPIIFFAFLQGLLIWYYHSTFIEIIWISIFCTLIPLVLFMFLYFIQYGKQK